LSAYPSELAFLQRDPDESKILKKSFVIAFVIETVVLTAAGFNGHWLAHPGAAADDTSKFIEAQIFQAPDKAVLVEDKPVAEPKKEIALAKHVDQGRKAKDDEKKVEDENQTVGGQKLAPTHGPVAVYAPAPVIPSYLQDREMHASVVIDFFVTSLNVATPKLVGSSGNDELDAIALATVKKWQFRAAENDHHATDAKVRLRIVFDVK
jgi:TonB family protein